MKHLLTEQKGSEITVKCGAVINAKVNREDATIWWGDVDCPVCRPYDWVDDPNGVGKMMVKRTEVPSKRRIVRTPHTPV